MNKDIIAGNGKRLRGKTQANRGHLADDVFDVAEGTAPGLAGKLRERYGRGRDRAESEVEDFRKTFD